MDRVIESFGWAGSMVSWRRLGRFTHAERMARWRSNEGNGASGRRAAVVLSVHQVGPQLVEISCESLAWIERQVEAADKCFVARTDSAGDCAQSGSHLCGVLRFQIVVDENDHRERKGFRSENFGGLFDVIVEDAKLVFLKIGDKIAPAVFGSDREDNEIGIDADFGPRFALLGGGVW